MASNTLRMAEKATTELGNVTKYESHTDSSAMVGQGTLSTTAHLLSSRACKNERPVHGSDGDVREEGCDSEAKHPVRYFERRAFLSSSASGLLTAAFAAPNGAHAATAAAADSRSIVTIRVQSPADRLGVQLTTTKLRGKSAVVVQEVPPGMILLDYSAASDVVQRLKSGPYPIDL